MKKFLMGLLICITTIILIPNNVYAAGSINVSTNNLNITRGSSRTFTVRANNSVGRVDISSSNSSVASVNVTNKWLENDSVTVTVKAVGNGSAKITVNLSDVATFDGQELKGSYTVNIKVTEPVYLSKNNNLKSLQIEGYDLIKNNDTNYSLNVSNNVDKIKINAVVEDSKSKLSGVGEKDLKVGDNTFEVVVTSESNAKKVYTIKVNKKDGFYLDELSDVINSSDGNEVDITIVKDDKISKDVLNDIKKSKKTIKFNQYNNDKKLLYSWSVDGSKIDDIIDINTNIEFTSNNKDKIEKLSNYANGVYLDFKHSGDLPNGTLVKIFVGDKFKDGNLINLYYLNEKNNKLEKTLSDIKVIDGYATFKIEHCSTYFASMSKVMDVVDSTDKVKDESTKNDKMVPISYIYSIVIVEALIILIVLIIVCIKKGVFKKIFKK